MILISPEAQADDEELPVDRDKNFLHQAIIRTSLLYGVTTWRPTTLSEMETLDQVQKRAIRTWRHLEQGSNKAMCRDSKLITIKETLNKKNMLQMWRIMFSKNPVDRKKILATWVRFDRKRKSPKSQSTVL